MYCKQKPTQQTKKKRKTSKNNLQTNKQKKKIMCRKLKKQKNDKKIEKKKLKRSSKKKRKQKRKQNRKKKGFITLDEKESIKMELNNKNIIFANNIYNLQLGMKYGCGIAFNPLLAGHIGISNKIESMNCEFPQGIQIPQHSFGRTKYDRVGFHINHIKHTCDIYYNAINLGTIFTNVPTVPRVQGNA